MMKRQFASAPPDRVSAGDQAPRQAAADPLQGSPRQVAQRERIASSFGPAAQLQAEPEPNRTGLPGSLKAGIESLSGMDLSDVRVHRNSDQPAQLNALAYAQGTDIHLAPGQEQHLPHEAWHVVQQAQGRVRPTLQLRAAVDVNDDEALEHEADVMGARAGHGLTQRVVGEPAPCLATSAPVAQRRIHAWTDGAWKPGAQGREGIHRLPEQPQGDARFFNDRTGASAKTAEEISDSLDHLAVQSGSVTEVMADGGAAMADMEQELPGLHDFAIALANGLVAEKRELQAYMKTLDDQYAQLPEGSEEEAENQRLYDEARASMEALDARTEALESDEKERAKEQTLFLGYFTFCAQDETWKWDPGGDACPAGAWKDKVSALLRGFMAANGQLAYIRSRPWYSDHTHQIEVDVNYYINRPFSTAPLYWHKDTGGGNLFVNLLFTNERPIVGTEYTADTQAVGAKKKASLQANMPATQVDEIERAREALKGQRLGTQIEIGELPRKGYVAWVDELIWHSSPFLANRTPWSPELATAVLTNFQAPDAKFKVQTATTYEAMVLIAGTPETQLAQWVARDGKQFDIDHAYGYADTGYWIGEKHDALVRQDIARVDWAVHKVNGAFGHEQDGADLRVKPAPEGPQDNKGKTQPFTLITPSGMGGRGRSASVSQTQKSLGALVNGDEHGRNFLRTWVRIKPR